MRKPFEGDRFIYAEVMRLCASYGVQTIIETGTEHGITTAAMAEFVPKVLTVELAPGYRPLAHKQNVEQFTGDSGVVMRSLIVLATQPILFYLDAHDATNSPLLEELAAIEDNVRDQIIQNPIIAIHDFNNWDYRERGFDSINGQPLDWNYVKVAVEKVYGPDGYNSYALPRSEGANRGALFILPKG